MNHHTIYRVVSFVLVISAFALSGCDVMKKTQSPPKQRVQDAVAAVLPPFLYLDSIEMEPISTGPDTVKVNFKAMVVPKEDLYQVDREVDGTPKVTLIKVVQTAKTKLSLYGSISTRLTVDQWTLESPEIMVGLRQFGVPRGAFNAQALITGSTEANNALQQQTENAKIQEQKRKAALEQQERERIAREEQQARDDESRRKLEEQARVELEKKRQDEMAQRKVEEEQRKKEEDAARQKLILATVQGTRYIGTISNGEKHLRFRLVFTEQKNFLVRAEVSNPDDANQTRIFTGELVFNAKPDGKSNVVYPIKMSPVDKGPKAPIGVGFGVFNPDSFNYFYYNDNSVSLQLRLTETGMDGDGGNGRFTIRMQRE